VVLMSLSGGGQHGTDVFSMWKTNYQLISDVCSISSGRGQRGSDASARWRTL